MSKVIPELTVREKIAVYILLMFLKLLQPWEYEHQYTPFFDSIKELLKGKEPKA